MKDFPENFLWGAATSAHQVEGNNLNSDWWEWERMGRLKESSGLACKHYELYQEDFDLAKLLNHNAHRFSLEWSRIEPQEGKFSSAEINHYRQVIISLRERDIEPIVTLHHFTNPLWFTQSGGWQDRRLIKYFLRYVDYVAEALGDKVNYWVTINEPLIYVYYAYIFGVWPPQKKSFFSAMSVLENLSLAHIQAYRLIHQVYKNKIQRDYPFISMAQNMQAFVSCTPTLKNRLAVYLRNKFYNFWFIDKLIRHKTLDFIGINYYGRNLVEAQNWHPLSLAFATCQKNHHPLRKNSLGWDIYPQGLYDLLLKTARYKLPILILENGICTEDDILRWDYIYEHLQNMHLAMEKGAKVLGYIYWSLIDNFEWDKGFSPRFGLIEVDYHTYKRSVRDSAKKFASLIQEGIIN
jgi:beta-glucosidase